MRSARRAAAAGLLAAVLIALATLTGLRQVTITVHPDTRPAYGYSCGTALTGSSTADTELITGGRPTAGTMIFIPVWVHVAVLACDGGVRRARLLALISLALGVGCLAAAVETLPRRRRRRG